MILSFKGPDEGLNASVYAELRKRIVTGFISPDHELSTRSLAGELGVSQTPRVCRLKERFPSGRSGGFASRK